MHPFKLPSRWPFGADAVLPSAQQIHPPRPSRFLGESLPRTFRRVHESLAQFLAPLRSVLANYPNLCQDDEARRRKRLPCTLDCPDVRRIEVLGNTECRLVVFLLRCLLGGLEHCRYCRSGRPRLCSFFSSVCIWSCHLPEEKMSVCLQNQYQYAKK